MMQSIINMYGLGAVSVQQVMGLVEESMCNIIDVEYEDLSDEIQQPSNSIEFPNAELIYQTRPRPKPISEWERDIICSQMGIRINAPETILKINI